MIAKIKQPYLFLLLAMDTYAVDNPGAGRIFPTFDHAPDTTAFLCGEYEHVTCKFKIASQASLFSLRHSVLFSP